MGGMGGMPGGVRIEFGGQEMGGMGGQRRPQPKPFPQVDDACWIRAGVSSIHAASRKSGISEDRDDARASLAGQTGVISFVDPRDKTVKVSARSMQARTHVTSHQLSPLTPVCPPPAHRFASVALRQASPSGERLRCGTRRTPSGTQS